MNKIFQMIEKGIVVGFFEDCDCGDRIRHNDGGNYHSRLLIRKTEGKYQIRRFTTSDLEEEGAWQPCESVPSAVAEGVNLNPCPINMDKKKKWFEEFDARLSKVVCGG